LVVEDEVCVAHGSSGFGVTALEGVIEFEDKGLILCQGHRNPYLRIRGIKEWFRP
jgi:hypothetical protein